MSKPKRDDFPEPLELALAVETENFEPIAADVFEALDRGKLNLFLVGPITQASMSDHDATILSKKYGMTKKEMKRYVGALIGITHFMVTGELEEFTKMVEEKSPENSESFRIKTLCVSKMLEKYPYVKDSYFVYSLCKTNFFAEMRWEAGLKATHSPGTIPRGAVPPTLPFATIVFEKYSAKDPMGETESFEFEISEKHLGLIIDSLKTLKNAMAELKHKKLV